MTKGWVLTIVELVSQLIKLTSEEGGHATPHLLGELPKKWKKSKRGGGSALKIKKSTIQNVDYFEMRGRGMDFKFFQKSNG